MFGLNFLEQEQKEAGPRFRTYFCLSPLFPVPASFSYVISWPFSALLGIGKSFHYFPTSMGLSCRSHPFKSFGTQNLELSELVGSGSRPKTGPRPSQTHSAPFKVEDQWVKYCLKKKRKKRVPVLKALPLPGFFLPFKVTFYTVLLVHFSFLVIGKICLSDFFKSWVLHALQTGSIFLWKGRNLGFCERLLKKLHSKPVPRL